MAWKKLFDNHVITMRWTAKVQVATHWQSSRWSGPPAATMSFALGHFRSNNSSDT